MYPPILESLEYKEQTVKGKLLNLLKLYLT